MTEKEIIEGKKLYNEQILKHKSLIEKKNEIRSLQENPTVKRYLELCDQVKNMKEENAINIAFNDIALKTENSNEILVYLGDYKFDTTYGKSNINNSKEPTELFELYKDLETEKEYYVKIKDHDTWANNHKIIYLINIAKNRYGHNRDTLNTLYEIYFNLREKFFKSLLVESQTEAIKQLIKK